MDAAVVQAGLAQGLEVGRAHARRIAAQLLRVGAERLVLRREAGPAPVRGDPRDEAIRLGLVLDPEVGDLGTEVVGVGAESVDAVVGHGGDHGEHLALAAAEG